MRRATLFCLAVLGMGTAYAEADKEIKDVVLEKRLGELSQQAPKNKTSTCQISRTHPQVKGILSNVTKWIDEADKADFTTSYHFMAQVPSVEIIAYRKVGDKNEKVILVEDYSTLKTRNGDAAQELIKLVNGICGK